MNLSMKKQFFSLCRGSKVGHMQVHYQCREDPLVLHLINHYHMILGETPETNRGFEGPIPVHNYEGNVLV